jgi:hypothetical protein
LAYFISKADERHNVAKMLNDDEWRQLDDATIARHCGVAGSLVEELRAAAPA